jgi:hypothetical protein
MTPDPTERYDHKTRHESDLFNSLLAAKPGRVRGGRPLPEVAEINRCSIGHGPGHRRRMDR